MKSLPIAALAALLFAGACGAPSPGRAVFLSAGRAVSHSATPKAGSFPKDSEPKGDPSQCTDLSGATAAKLVGAAWAAIDGGKDERALACAEAAVTVAPRSVSALSVRAGALVALNRLDEARTAYARALAVDPDDPEALLGAAEVYVRRIGTARDVLETGLVHALRGVRFAARRKERDLLGRLELVAGMAENDLGRSQLALPHLKRAVAARPTDPDAVYEKGIALFELCRFDEAQRDFERALVLAPDDPWALYELGLLAERNGDERRATSLMAKAHILAPKDIRPDVNVSAVAFRNEVDVALAALPQEERRALHGVPVEIEDLPQLSDLLAVQPPLSPSILGLFRGPSENEACTPADGQRCRTIVIYRKNLLRFARDEKELKEQVRITLLHEIGHLHGLDDEELRARGLE